MIEDFDHLLKTTRSVRRRLDLEREVPDEIIEACIKCQMRSSRLALKLPFRRRLV